MNRSLSWTRFGVPSSIWRTVRLVTSNDFAEMGCSQQKSLEVHGDGAMMRRHAMFFRYPETEALLISAVYQGDDFRPHFKRDSNSKMH